VGGSKATVRLNGRPLISYPLGAVQEALGNAVVVAKADTDLPSLPGVEVWIEPPEPRHPLAGIVHALGSAGGRPVLVCACDLPLVQAGLVREIAAAEPEDALVVMACAEGRPQPLLACYQPRALPPLAATLAGSDAPGVLDAVAALGVRCHQVSDPTLLFNVNTPEDLLRAGALLSDQPNVKS
jgi:molybdopterin-guanine dinucleotide biosynthesis protein A